MQRNGRMSTSTVAGKKTSCWCGSNTRPYHPHHVRSCMAAGPACPLCMQPMHTNLFTPLHVFTPCMYTSIACPVPIIACAHLCRQVSAAQAP